MTYVLYGIVFSPARNGNGRGHPVLPVGVEGEPVRLIETNGLGAVVSLIDPRDLTPGVERVLAFARVVEALHADRSVVPLRYGAILEDERAVVELLRGRGEEYAAALRGLEGCAEMSVRILSLPPVSPPRGFAPTVETSGRAFLTRLAARYAGEEAGQEVLAASVERVRAVLGALAERTRIERSARSGQSLVSLDFLVKRGTLDAFRTAFRRIESAEPSRLLLSGPWPPYSFVAPERDGSPTDG